LLPFHREFLKILEFSMRSLDPEAALPYWDTTLDSGLPDPSDSILWTELFLGEPRGDVTTGAFGNWTTLVDKVVGPLSPSGYITRNASHLPEELWTDDDIEEVMSKPRFRNLVKCVDPYYNNLHGAIHVWVGGHNYKLRTAASDPVFFLIHCFQDSIWEQWRQTHQNRTQREIEYTSDNESCDPLATANATMLPWKLTNIEGLSNRYTDIIYSYEPKPNCTKSAPDCGSPYLFCHTGRPKCLSKIRLDGNCTGLEEFDACFGGKCVGGRCGLGSGGGAANATVTLAPIAGQPGNQTSTAKSH